ncbi:hypothetical protein RRSWK_04502 [Rhodopirellula sp. SWK7]|nr:hypothetical protein RRSWK_04502 [Rhodopirellula sp. SWK7]
MKPLTTPNLLSASVPVVSSVSRFCSRDPTRPEAVMPHSNGTAFFA